MQIFKWIIKDFLAGGCHPLKNKSFDSSSGIDWYTARGIKTVIDVFDCPLPSKILSSVPWNYVSTKTEDGMAPDDLLGLCKIIENSGPTFVHCFMGIGRTATVLASYLMYCGEVATAKEAILELRETYSKNAVQTKQQYLALLKFGNEERSNIELAIDFKDLRLSDGIKKKK